MKPMIKGRSAAMMKVAERSGGRIATNEEYYALVSYEPIPEDAVASCLRPVG
jgi:hypothetical protein